MSLSITKPRVSWCAFTRKWIVSPRGNRHECGRTSYKSDIAFRRWPDAMREANMIAWERVIGLWHGMSGMDRPS